MIPWEKLDVTIWRKLQGSPGGILLGKLRGLAKKDPEKYLPELAKTLDCLAERHTPSESFWGKLLDRILPRRAWKNPEKAQAERAEALEIASRYPENPDCKRILEKSKK